MELEEKRYKVLDKKRYSGKGRPKWGDYDYYDERLVDGKVVQRFVNGMVSELSAEVSKGSD